MTELVGDVVELARAPGEDAIARRDVALDELPATRSSARSVALARSGSCRTSSPPWSTPMPSGWAGRSRTCSTTPASGARPSGGSTCRSPADGHRSRPRARVPCRRSGQGLRPVLARRRRARKPGSGLGLAIVQRVADEHDGRPAPRTPRTAARWSACGCPRSRREGPERELELEASVRVVQGVAEELPQAISR